MPNQISILVLMRNSERKLSSKDENEIKEVFKSKLFPFQDGGGGEALFIMLLLPCVLSQTRIL